MKTKQILVSLFLLSGIAIVFIILKLNALGKKSFANEKSAKSYVLDIYQGYKGKPNYKVMLLADSQTFTVPKQVLTTLQKGDSVKKLKGNNFFEIKLRNSASFTKVYYP